MFSAGDKVIFNPKVNPVFPEFEKYVGQKAIFIAKDTSKYPGNAGYPLKVKFSDGQIFHCKEDGSVILAKDRDLVVAEVQDLF